MSLTTSIAIMVANHGFSEQDLRKRFGDAALYPRSLKGAIAHLKDAGIEPPPSMIAALSVGSVSRSRRHVDGGTLQRVTTNGRTSVEVSKSIGASPGSDVIVTCRRGAVVIKKAP